MPQVYHRRVICQMCSPDTYPPPLTPILPLSSLDTYPPSLRTKIARTVRHVKVIQKSIKPVLTKQFVMPGFPFSPLPPKRQGQARGCRRNPSGCASGNGSRAESPGWQATGLVHDIYGLRRFSLTGRPDRRRFRRWSRRS